MSDPGTFFEQRGVPVADDDRKRRARPWRRFLPAAIAAVVLLAAIGAWFLFTGGDDDVDTVDLLDRAVAAHESGDTEEASQLYSEVLEADPTNKVALFNLGVISQGVGNITDAEREYQAALVVDPAYEPALFNLAVIKYDAGDYQAAIDLYRRLIVTNPNNANAYLNLGFALRANGDQAQGDQAIATAITLDPSLASRVPEDSETPSEETTTTIEGADSGQ